MAARHYELASSLLSQDRLTQAGDEIRRALTLIPRWPAALNLSGVIAQRQGRIEDAILIFKKILSFHPDHLTVATNLGNAFLSQGDHRKALRHFDRVLELDSANSKAWAGRSRALLIDDRIKEAYSAALRADECSPKDPETLILLSRLNFKQGQISQGLERARQVGELAWENGQGQRYLGLFLLEHQQFHAALPHLERALELGARDGPLLQSLGYGYLTASQLTKALPRLEESIIADPQNAKSYYLLGIGYEMQGRYAEAVDQLGKVLRLQPSHLEATHRFGVNLYKQGSPDKAWEAFKEVLQREPKRVEALYYQSLILLLKDDYVKGAALLQKLLTLDEQHVAAYFKLAQIYTRLGKKEEARYARKRYETLREEYSTHLRKVVFRIP